MRPAQCEYVRRAAYKDKSGSGEGGGKGSSGEERESVDEAVLVGARERVVLAGRARGGRAVRRANIILVRGVGTAAALNGPRRLEPGGAIR